MNDAERLFKNAKQPDTVIDVLSKHTKRPMTFYEIVVRLEKERSRAAIARELRKLKAHGEVKHFSVKVGKYTLWLYSLEQKTESL